MVKRLRKYVQYIRKYLTKYASFLARSANLLEGLYILQMFFLNFYLFLFFNGRLSSPRSSDINGAIFTKISGLVERCKGLLTSLSFFDFSRDVAMATSQSRKIGEKSNRWSLCLSVSHLYGRPSMVRRRSYWSQLAACAGDIFSKSTVAQTKMRHVSKTTPLLGVICLPFDNT